MADESTLPFDETARLAALHRAEILDTPPEPEFDNIVRLAAAICEVPMALVSLVDEGRQWFKARVGLALQETPREHSFCAHALTHQGPMTVADASLDARFQDNPLVTGDPNIRFYTGVPLRTSEGSAVGTLCVIDRVPRQLTPLQAEALRMLADQAASEIKLRTELAGRPPKSAFGGGKTSMEATGHSASPGEMDKDPEAALLISRVPLDRRYRLVESLGRGGMGFVLGAQDLAENRKVAIKFLRRHVDRVEDHILRFAREARTLMKLQSPYVVRVFDVGNTSDGIPYIVMERLEGEDLGARIERHGCLPINDVVRIGLQACDVLGEAHDLGLVHRDLKPGNLFLVRNAQGEETLKVLDFGIAKVLANEGVTSGDTTDTSTVLGSPHYMPPEQMFGDPKIDGQADVWAMGVVMYQALTGQLPFAGNSLREIFQAVLTQEPVDVRALRPEVPEAFANLITLCLRRERENRLPGAWALARQLATLHHAAASVG